MVDFSTSLDLAHELQSHELQSDELQSDELQYNARIWWNAAVTPPGQEGDEYLSSHSPLVVTVQFAIWNKED